MRLAWSIAGLFVLASPSTALAYQRATVDGSPDLGLVWDDRAISIELASGSSPDVGPVELRAALGRSLSTWTTPACSDLVLADVGDALGLSTNLVDGHADGLNRVVVREDGWPVEVGPETLALTSIVYDRSTGRILDADIDLNASAHAFASSSPAAEDRDDVENTLTHELGHLIGFAHVLDPDATMFGSAELGETRKRDLAADDVAALCETYPAGRPSPTTLPVVSAAGGCTASRAGASGSASLAALAWLIARAGRRSHRRARADETAS